MNEALRWTFLIYFITHIPITLVLDLQVIFGEYYPPALGSVMTFYLSSYNDLVLARSPLWLKSFIWAEFLFQMPFFFAATYALWNRKNWLRIPAIAYGVHVATTVWAILAEILLSDEQTTTEKVTLFGFYAPYFIIPALLAGYMMLNEAPFGTKPKKG